jgi:predicted CXXCH cytochrome family protein
MRNITLLIITGFIFITSCTVENKEPYKETKKQGSHPEYLGAESCKECHQQEHGEWEKSDHFFSMQKATSQFVKADFNTSFTADKIQYRFRKKDSVYLVDITDQNEPTQTFEVAYTFGWEPLQQYLLKAKNGKFQTLRATWDTKKNLWFHQSAGTIVEPHDWLSWSKGGQNWNTMCSSCHSTHLKKNYNESTESFSTSYTEINVACESCHGAGGRHLDAQDNPKLTDPYQKQSLSNNKSQFDNCGACHARRTMLEDLSDPSNEFLHRFIPQNLTNAFYEADGQIDGEDFVYGSFLTSKMYRNHVSCSNCHNPHSGEMKMEGNALCLQCHEPSYNSEEHHHHEGIEGTEGTSCVSCHMDGKVYMGNDYRKDHSFRVPRPDQSVKYKTSNACNSCHTDKSSKWAESAVIKWYGNERAYHFSDDLLPGSLLDDKSFNHLSNLMKNDSVPTIVKSTALEYLQYINSSESFDLILKSLQHKEALVRQAGYVSLLSFPEQLRKEPGLKGLRDKVKAVRIMAFRSISNLDVKTLNPTDLSVWNQVNGEYFTYLKGNSDFPNGQTLIGEYYLQQGDYNRAVTAFNRALKMDSLQVSPYTNLAILYSGKSESLKVQGVLNEGLAKFPENAQMYYFIGLNEGALNNMDGQITGLKRAYELEPSNVKYAYNYILTMYETKIEKNQKEAIMILSDALKIYPKNQKLLELYGYMVKKGN